MEYILIALLAGAVFGLCYLADKAYTKLFRSKQQHKSGLSLRQNKRYGSIGMVLTVIGVAGVIGGIGDRVAVLVGSLVIAVLGVGLIVYYMSTGIYYDDDSFLWESLGKKRRAYRYDQILHQQLYVMQGGGTIIELHMTDGSAVQVVSNMPDYQKFLNHAFRNYCRQKGLDPDNCAFYDPEKSLWFPIKEEV